MWFQSSQTDDSGFYCNIIVAYGCSHICVCWRFVELRWCSGSWKLLCSLHIPACFLCVLLKSHCSLYSFTDRDVPVLCHLLQYHNQNTCYIRKLVIIVTVKTLIQWPIIETQNLNFSACCMPPVLLKMCASNYCHCCPKWRVTCYVDTVLWAKEKRTRAGPDLPHSTSGWYLASTHVIKWL